MPIRPENRARYPGNWASEIRPGILARAGNCCEGSPKFPDCRVPNGELGGWLGAVWHAALPLGQKHGGLWWPEPGEYAWCEAGERLRIIRIVLTVAHLDHTPENCDPDNLRAWCQRCHLAYDQQHHAETAAATRRAKKASGDLFTNPPAAPASQETTDA